ncbi:MAG: hypothetical protein LBR11_13265 [Deltaproteobacteria bacterium]|jgi:hypothetical protein|nr:hypothetical protein [Deltaproteobacteria bacterium]
MKKFFGFILVGILFLALWAGQALAQDESRQNPRADPRDDPDDLLRQMFSEEPEAPAPPTKAPQSAPSVKPSQDNGGGPIQNLPGEPSPVKNPAKPGEAKIERPNAPARVGPNYRRTPRASDYLPFQQRWFHAEDAWSQDLPNIVTLCPSLVPNRPLYHISCVEGVRPQIHR